MNPPHIEIIQKRDDKLQIHISIQGEEAWEKEYHQETPINLLLEEYKNATNNDFPPEILSAWQNQKSTEDIKNQQLKNFVNKYEEGILVLGNNEQKIPEIIGKPFNDPFTVFAFMKKKKILQVLNFEGKDIKGLENYGPYSAYCNGNNKLYISGGETNDKINIDKFWVIDLNSLNVECINMIPKKNHSMIVIPGNYVFFVGGQDKETFYYDMEKDNHFYGWKPLKKNRTEPALILVDSHLYCFDNVNSVQSSTFTFEKTDLSAENGEWELMHVNMPDINFDQKFFGVVKKDDDIMFIGGNIYIEEEDRNRAIKRKNFKYNITENKIEESEIPFIECNLKEKTFLPYNNNIYYIFPDFNKHHPEVIFYQKEKNEIKLVKYKSQIEEKRDLPPAKINRVNFDQPKSDENINAEKKINADSENKEIVDGDNGLNSSDIKNNKESQIKKNNNGNFEDKSNKEGMERKEEIISNILKDPNNDSLINRSKIMKSKNIEMEKSSENKDDIKENQKKMNEVNNNFDNDNNKSDKNSSNNLDMNGEKNSRQEIKEDNEDKMNVIRSKKSEVSEKPNNSANEENKEKVISGEPVTVGDPNVKTINISKNSSNGAFQIKISNNNNNEPNIHEKNNIENEQLKIDNGQKLEESHAGSINSQKSGEKEKKSKKESQVEIPVEKDKIEKEVSSFYQSGIIGGDSYMVKDNILGGEEKDNPQKDNIKQIVGNKKENADVPKSDLKESNIEAKGPSDEVDVNKKQNLDIKNESKEFEKDFCLCGVIIGSKETDPNILKLDKKENNIDKSKNQQKKEVKINDGNPNQIKINADSNINVIKPEVNPPKDSTQIKEPIINVEDINLKKNIQSIVPSSDINIENQINNEDLILPKSEINKNPQGEIIPVQNIDIPSGQNDIKGNISDNPNEKNPKTSIKYNSNIPEIKLTGPDTKTPIQLPGSVNKNDFEVNPFVMDLKKQNQEKKESKDSKKESNGSVVISTGIIGGNKEPKNNQNKNLPSENKSDININGPKLDFNGNIVNANAPRVEIKGSEQNEISLNLQENSKNNENKEEKKEKPKDFFHISGIIRPKKTKENKKDNNKKDKSEPKKEEKNDISGNAELKINLNYEENKKENDLNIQNIDQDKNEERNVNLKISEIGQKGKKINLPSVGIQNNNFVSSKVDEGGNLNEINIDMDNLKTANVGINGQKNGIRTDN